MAEYAEVRSGRIANRVVWDGAAPFEPSGDLIEADTLPEGWDIGWQLFEGAWAPPPSTEGDGE